MNTAAVVLAAGKGTRFVSERAKVLHPAAGQSLLRWVLDALRPLELTRVIVVVGHQADAVRDEAMAAAVPGLVTVVQDEQLGTGHAVRCALEAGALDGIERVLVLPGDAPLLQARELALLLHGDEDVVLLTAMADEPTGYGRIIRGVDGAVREIVEERDASVTQRAVQEINAGMYVFAAERLAKELAGLQRSNAQGEMYLTDVVAPMGPARAVVVAEEAIAGVNDRAQLADAAAVLRARINQRHLLAGVSIVDPRTTYIDETVEIAADATILPNTHLEGRTRIAAGAVIGPDSRLIDSEVGEGATVANSVLREAVVGPEATVGPFTYLRPGTQLARGSKAGAFVEIKNTTVGEGSKVPHLSYIGDTTIGQQVNVGAGTITCNFDGHNKHRTVIGDGAFIGSDTMLVAPVVIGAGAVTAAGSAITRDVAPNALALERSEQHEVPGYADRRAAENGDDDGVS